VLLVNAAAEDHIPEGARNKQEPEDNGGPPRSHET
jgi:hypothetical protein